MDISRVSKLSLYGYGLLYIVLYNEYSSHGNIWYIVITSKSANLVGITWNSVVTVFNNIDQKGYLNYDK